MSKTWEKLLPHDRIVAVHVDISNHKDFAALSGVVYVGDVKINDDIPTAGTNGRDVWYGTAFLMAQNRKQLRYLCLHEQGHKALQHCTLYKPLVTKYPRLSNMSMDHVVNNMLEEMDPTYSFIEPCAVVAPLCDKQYKGWSFVEVLQDLLKKAKKGKGG